MLNKYRLYQRANGVFYWQDQESSKQGSLKTKDREIAESFFAVRTNPGVHLVARVNRKSLAPDYIRSPFFLGRVEVGTDCSG